MIIFINRNDCWMYRMCDVHDKFAFHEHHRVDGKQFTNIEFEYYANKNFCKGFYINDDIPGKTSESIRIINGYIMKNYVKGDII